MLYIPKRKQKKLCKYCSAKLHKDDEEIGYCKGSYSCIRKEKKIKLTDRVTFYDPHKNKRKKDKTDRNNLMHAPSVKSESRFLRRKV